MTTTYDQGEVAEMTATFTTTDTGITVDPASVYVVLLKPDLATYERGQYNNPGGDQGGAVTITRLGAGSYRAAVSLDQGGTWAGRFYSTGTGQGSVQFTLTVNGDTLT